MRSAVRTHKRTRKNGVSVVKRHSRSFLKKSKKRKPKKSKHAPGQHPNSVKSRIKSKSVKPKMPTKKVGVKIKPKAKGVHPLHELKHQIMSAGHIYNRVKHAVSTAAGKLH